MQLKVLIFTQYRMISVIITTYNRPKKCLELVTLIRKESNKIPIIIVDSGDAKFSNTDNYQEVKIVISNHKNQPFQRFLGHANVKTDWILYLDDDMEPLEGSFKILENLILEKGKQYGLFALKFLDKHQNSFLKKQKKSILKNLKIIAFFKAFTGYPILPEGHFGKNGIRGVQPKNGGQTFYTSGGAFLVNKKYLYKNFNMQLFDLFEKRLGMGEDVILGYTISKQTKLYYYPKQLFWHNDQANSVYTKNEKQFNKIVAFSRLYLNLEYARLNNKSIVFARLSYLWFVNWRLIGLALNLIIKPTKINYNKFSGYFKGVLMSFLFKFDSKLRANQYWINELKK